MKKTLLMIGSTLFVFGLASCTYKELKENPVSTAGDVEGNILSDGSFSGDYSIVQGSSYQGWGAWGIYGMAGGRGYFSVNSDKQLVIKSDLSAASQDHSVQLNQKGLTISKGVEYTISFDMYAQNPQTAYVIIQQDYSPYTAYFKKEIKIKRTVTHYEFKYKCDTNDDKCSFVINMGKFPKDKVTENVIIVDDVTLLSDQASSGDTTEHKNVLVNQVGYLTNEKKTAVFRGENADQSFEILDASTRKSVYTGVVSKAVKDKDSEDYLGTADFSDFETPGKYILHGENCGDSYTFEIKDNVYSDLLSEMTRMLYLQRCGCEVKDSTFGHKACHTDKAKLYGLNEYIDVSGGWHDAGDYGKYVVPGAKTVEDLLLTYELYNDVSYTTDKENAGNLLDEAAYELDWMLKMQNSKGEVYHKITSYEFPGTEVLPQDDDLKMIVSDVSYAATADFAAVMAHASQVYKATDETRALLYKNAAVKAYDALASMKQTSFKNPISITTGEYPDSKLSDEYLWAASALYSATKDEKYLSDFRASFKNASNIGFGWDNMTGYAYYSYIRAGLGDETEASIKSLMKNQADELIGNIKSSGYGSALSELYPWGSNMNICNAAMLFSLMDTYSEESLFDYSLDEINYLLGVNTLEYCYVTGFGEKSPSKPHHRVCITKKQAIPGMLVGGPNNDFENNGGDAIATSKLQNKVSGPASYIDHDNSWSTNEVTIYWNSPLIFVLASTMKK